MREIKFRAYISKQHKNYNFDAGMYGWDDVKTWAYLWEMVEGGLVELMQFTGLKDKNGIGIYEGDIVKIGNFPDSVKVFWDNDKAAYYTSRLKGNIGDRLLCDFAWSEHNIVEIIGNIYQNKELLEDSRE